MDIKSIEALASLIFESDLLLELNKVTKLALAGKLDPAYAKKVLRRHNFNTRDEYKPSMKERIEKSKERGSPYDFLTSRKKMKRIRKGEYLQLGGGYVGNIIKAPELPGKGFKEVQKKTNLLK